MQVLQPTVRMERTHRDDIIIMVWDHDVYKPDVQSAFAEITAMLDQTDKPIYVIVDLLSNPMFPVQTTVSAAMAGPFEHPMLAEWLVIGANSTARLIARTLTTLAGIDNIRWFKSVDEALNHVQTAD